MCRYDTTSEGGGAFMPIRYFSNYKNAAFEVRTAGETLANSPHTLRHFHCILVDILAMIPALNISRDFADLYCISCNSVITPALRDTIYNFWHSPLHDMASFSHHPWHYLWHCMTVFFSTLLIFRDTPFISLHSFSWHTFFVILLIPWDAPCNSWQFQYLIILLLYLFSHRCLMLADVCCHLHLRNLDHIACVSTYPYMLLCVSGWKVRFFQHKWKSLFAVRLPIAEYVWNSLDPWRSHNTNH